MNHIKSLCIIFYALINLNILKHYDQKSQTRKFKHNFFSQNVSIPPYTTNAHFYNPSVKIGSISFFLSYDTQNFHHLLGWHANDIISSLIFFLSDLHFSNLICQAKSLRRIIVSGSSSSQLVLQRLILLRFTLKTPILLQVNTTLPESSLK